MEAQRKNSKKRQAILDEFCGSYEHPTAEMIYAALKPRFPELSLGTVYRNIAVLAEEGLVVSVGNVAGQERYDARTDPHAHFVCTGCGRVLDLPIAETLSDMLPRIEAETGFLAESCTLTVKGLCPDCREQ